MEIIDGEVAEISQLDPNKNGSYKKVLTLIISKEEKAFIEVQGAILSHLNNIRIGERVQIGFKFKAHTSKAGTRFNNLIAQRVKKTK